MSSAAIAAHYVQKDYRAEVLADSPLLYWRLGEASGTTAADEAANYAGTISGSPSMGTTGLLVGDANKAITFDGTNDYVTSAAITQDQTAFTIEALVKPASTHASTPGFIAGRIGNTTATNINNLDIYQGKIRFYAFNTAGAASAGTGTQSYSITAGATYHIVGTFSGGTLSLYVNGSLVGTDTVSGTFNGAADVALTAGRRAADRYFSGVIDEVAYYSTALSAARVAVHYAAARGA